jgi:hypothetical protein
MSSPLWDITRCSPLKITPRFGGTYYFCLQGRSVNQTRNQYKSSACLLHAGFLAWVILRRDGRGDIFLRNVVWLQRSTQRYIPEDTTLYNDRCEYPKSYSHRSTQELVGLSVGHFESGQPLNIAVHVLITMAASSVGQDIYWIIAHLVKEFRTFHGKSEGSLPSSPEPVSGSFHRPDWCSIHLSHSISSLSILILSSYIPLTSNDSLPCKYDFLFLLCMLYVWFISSPSIWPP